MADEQTAKSQMEIDVFIAIVIPDATPLSTANKQRIRWYSLKRTGYPHRQGYLATLMNLMRTRSPFFKLCLLSCNNLSYQLRVNRNRLAKHTSSFPEGNYLTVSNS